MSGKSSSTVLRTSFQLAQKYLYRFAGPLFLVVGVLSCLLCLMVFTRKKLRKSTCSIYFIAFNIASFLFIILSLLSFTLEIGYNIAPALHSLFYCRFREYFAFLLNYLCPHFLLFASIDRVLVTSRNAGTRQKSTRRLAYTMIGIVTFICSLILIHVVFFTNILQIAPDYLYCYIEPGRYSVAISYISLVKEIAIPSLLALCGFWSLKNIRTIRYITVGSLPTGPNRTVLYIPRDRQFILMIAIDIVVYILFNLIMPISLLYDQITQYQERSFEQTQIVLLLRNIAIFSVHIPFCISCYTHVLVSKTFRNEVKNVLLGK